MERKILLFAKLMSLCFAGMGLFSLCDLALTPKSQIQYVLAHETETGYRSTSKYGAQNFRDNYLHCVSFRSHVPYRLRPGYEIDTLLLYQTPEIRTQEAKDYLLAQKMNQARNTAKLGTQASLNISDKTEDFLVSKVPGSQNLLRPRRWRFYSFVCESAAIENCGLHPVSLARLAQYERKTNASIDECDQSGSQTVAVNHPSVFFDCPGTLWYYLDGKAISHIRRTVCI